MTCILHRITVCYLLLQVLILLPSIAYAQIKPPVFKDSVEVHQTNSIYFDFGKSEITSAADSILRDTWSNTKPGLEIYLEGHTDAVGSVRANEILAEKRAAAVSARMQELGWEPSLVKTRSFGEKRLAVKTNNQEIRNRRVFIRTGLPQKYRLFRGRAVDTLGVPLPASVIAHGKYLRDTTIADEEGYFSLWLPVNQVVGLDIYAPGYLFFSQLFRVDGEAKADFNITLEKAVAGAKMDVPDLYFVGNQTNLLPGGQKGALRVLNFLEMNPAVKIEIAGHVNYPGLPQKEGSFSWNLANGRAEYIKTYLIEKGIAAERLLAKGYSNYSMRYPKPRNPRQEQENRRVEIIIQ